MRMCVSLLASGVVYVPRKDRVKIYAPLKMLLWAIAETWTECAAPALGALDHIAELQGTFNGDDDERITLDKARQLDEKIKAERAGLKNDLRKLSETLLNANAARADEMLAELKTLHANIADVGADAHAARVAAERTADELAGWRDWVKRIGKADGKRDAQRRTPPLCRPLADAVCKTWNDYESGTADCELPNGKWRKIKRTYGECLEAHGADIIYHSNATGLDYTLSELAPDADTFKRIVNAGRMRETRQPAPTRKRKNAQAAHKRARK